MPIHVVVPMAGRSERFARAGFVDPKALLPVEGRPMIAAVMDLFGPTPIFHVVVAASQLRDRPGLPDELRSFAPDVRVVVVADHDDGPVRSVLAVPLPDLDPVVVCYTDLLVDWDRDAFFRALPTHDGLFVHFQGFHPASYGRAVFAYARADGNRVLEVAEKRHFTGDRRGEPAATGIHGFRTGALLRRLAQEELAAPSSALPERYVSELQGRLAQEGGDVRLFAVDRFFCLGTPEDYRSHLDWQRWAASDPARPKPGPPDRTQLLPMAGSGDRFRRAGFNRPKPLIQIHGEPMLRRAMGCLPPAGRTTVVLRADDPDHTDVLDEVRHFCPGVRAVLLPGATAGPADSCQQALSPADLDREIVVASCDYEHEHDDDELDQLRADPTIDAVVFLIRPGAMPLSRPDAFAWARVDDRGRVLGIVEKRALSDQPWLDPLVVGTFWFRRGAVLAAAVDAGRAAGRTVGGELYVGTCLDEAISSGLQVAALFVKRWHSFGDPFEWQIARFWQDHFAREPTHGPS